MNRRVAILGPVWLPDLLEFLPVDERGKLSHVSGMGGYGLTALLRARLLRGWPTDIITMDTSIRSMMYVQSPLLNMFICPCRERHKYRDALRLERQYLAKAIDQSKADILHAHWTYVYALAALRAASRKVLITIRDHAGNIRKRSSWGYLPDYLMTRYVLLKGRHFSAVSPYNAAYAASLGKSNISIIPNCVSDVVMKTASLIEQKDDRFIVSSALSDAPYKNAEKALRAFSKFHAVHKKSVYFVMGKGLNEDGAIAVKARAKGYSEGIVFLGALPHDKVVEVFSRSQVILHPSLEEACSNVLLDGMALGKVIIAGDCSGGCPWVLDDGKAGFLTDVTSPDAMVSSLNTVFENKKSAQEKAQYGRKLAETRFSPSVILAAYERIYDCLR